MSHSRLPHLLTGNTCNYTRYYYKKIGQQCETFVEMLHLADTSAQADFISSVQLQTLRILGQTTADLNCKPISAAIAVLRTYLE